MDRQEFLDAFYFRHGPCCAGCDRWHSLNSAVGECTKSAPMSGAERAVMVGISKCSMDIGAGHAITPKDHHCGDFKDAFDWSSLPLAYRRRVGAPSTSSSEAAAPLNRPPHG